jgi:hypothetical protein
VNVVLGITCSVVVLAVEVNLVQYIIVGSGDLFCIHWDRGELRVVESKAFFIWSDLKRSYCVLSIYAVATVDDHLCAHTCPSIWSCSMRKEYLVNLEQGSLIVDEKV